MPTWIFPNLFLQAFVTLYPRNIVLTLVSVLTLSLVYHESPFMMQARCVWFSWMTKAYSIAPPYVSVTFFNWPLTALHHQPRICNVNPFAGTYQCKVFIECHDFFKWEEVEKGSKVQFTPVLKASSTTKHYGKKQKKMTKPTKSKSKTKEKFLTFPTARWEKNTPLPNKMTVDAKTYLWKWLHLPTSMVSGSADRLLLLCRLSLS